jgi:hypothetical protein
VEGIGIIRRNRFLVDSVYSCEGTAERPTRGIFGGWYGLVASCRRIRTQIDRRCRRR